MSLSSSVEGYCQNIIELLISKVSTSGNVISNQSQPKSGLDQVLNFKQSCLDISPKFTFLNEKKKVLVYISC
jgi:hypothetical protein